MGMDRSTEFTLLGQSIHNCTACPLHGLVDKPLFLQGNKNPRVTVVGPGPTSWERKNGQAWSGKYGGYMRGLMRDVGMGTTPTAWMHVVCCGDQPNQKHIDACRLNARRQLQTLDAPYTLVVGQVAAQALLGFPVILKDIRGVWWKPPTGGWAMTINHPSATMHGYAAGHEAVLKRDLDKFAKSVLFGDLYPPKLDETCVKCTQWATHFRNGIAFCSKHSPRALKRGKEHQQLSLLGELDKE